MSHVTLILYYHCIHVNIAYLFIITCTLVAIDMILGRFECNTINENVGLLDCVDYEVHND